MRLAHVLMTALTVAGLVAPSSGALAAQGDTSQARRLERQDDESDHLIRIVMNRRARLGIKVNLQARDTDSLGAYVESVTPNGPAAKAGLRSGDVITKLDGQSVLTGGEADEPAMAWHQRERAALLRSRLALARGDDESARSLASTLALEAEARGSLRHARFARVVEAMSLAAAGEPPGLGALDALLAEVEGVAGLEAWRLSADLARYLPPDPAAAISAGAQRRASRLLAATPPADRPALESWVSRVLGD